MTGGPPRCVGNPACLETVAARPSTARSRDWRHGTVQWGVECVGIEVFPHTPSPRPQHPIPALGSWVAAASSRHPMTRY